MNTRLAWLALGALFCVRQLPAQARWRVDADAGISRARLQASAPAGGESLTGIVVSGQARVTLGMFGLAMTYGQGSLSPDTGLAPARDVVEGGIVVEARPLPWVVVGVGPYARAYAATAGSAERWMLWTGRVRAEGEIVPGMVRAYAEGWVAVASTVNIQPGAAGARGGRVGLTLRPPQSRLWARLGYAVDQARFKLAARAETLEMIQLAVGIGGR